ncbi:MAG: FAD-dependent oxidoreductase, partial [Alphaproteobacteria bacterium]
MDADVIVVGGGPVGLGLALELGRRGVGVRVLERAATLHRIPKGQNLTQRTGEHFRAWGIGEAVRAASPIPRGFGNSGLVAWRKILGDYSYDWFQRSAVGAYYFAENERLPQYRLEAVMRSRAAELDDVTVEYGTEVTAIAESGAAVEVVCRDAEGAIRRLRSAFVVGCDGARSLVREAAGIAQAVDHKGPRMALVVFRSMELHRILERFPGKAIFNTMDPALKGYWKFLGRVDLEGGWFYHAPVPNGTTAENFDFRACLHETVGAPFALEFEHIGFWDLRIAQARHYRAGRVFIAGDACHSHPPYGGYGVNTGLEDARNLGWKLAAHLEGWAGARLLDSYEEERHPVFASTSADFIARMIRDDRAFAERFAPEKDRAAFEAAWAERAAGGNRDVTGFRPHYAGSSLVFGPPGAASGAKASHSFTAEPGHHLAPQPLTRGRDLWEALGPGFTLIDLSGAAGAFE